MAYALAPEAGFTDGLIDDKGGWYFQGNVFFAWDTPQNFTIPLYKLHNPTTNDWAVATSTDSNPPNVPGFTSQTIFAYVYSTQVCGSVPLFGASKAATGSHFYTTKANDHSRLITISGWVDTGVAAFVLPPS